MKTYQEHKNEAIEIAINWQNKIAEAGDYSYSELAEIDQYLERMARRYGLVKEFRENGII